MARFQPWSGRSALAALVRAHRQLQVRAIAAVASESGLSRHRYRARVSVVSVLKFATNMDCPRNIVGFGGTQPYLHLFEDRPDALPRAACFPAPIPRAGSPDGVLFPADGHAAPAGARTCWRRQSPSGWFFPSGSRHAAPTSCRMNLTSAALAWFLLLGLWQLMLRYASDRRGKIDSRGSGSPPTGYERATRTGT
jgi:membrane-associated PAP2 superfamily phosphatase